jgi:integrase
LEPDGLIFYSRQRNAYASGWYSSQVFPDAARKVGVPQARPHDLRHFYASLLVAQGVDVVSIAAAFGDRPEEIWRTYAHGTEDSETRIRKALDAAIGGTEMASIKESSL